MDLTLNQRRRAMKYAEKTYCAVSDDDIELDDDIEHNQLNFAPTNGGTWVRAWVWCPESEYKEPK